MLEGHPLRQAWYPLTACTDSFCKRMQGSGHSTLFCFGSAVGDTTMLASSSMGSSRSSSERLSLLTAGFQLHGSPSGRHADPPLASFDCISGQGTYVSTNATWCHVYFGILSYVNLSFSPQPVEDLVIKCRHNNNVVDGLDNTHVFMFLRRSTLGMWFICILSDFSSLDRPQTCSLILFFNIRKL